MSTAGSARGRSDAAMAAGSRVGRSPWTFTTTSWRPCGSSLSAASWMRSEPEAWSERVITAMPPAFSTARGDPGIVGRHRDSADSRLHGPAPDMDDHRLAGDVGERLAGQARRREAGRDEDDGVGHGCAGVTKAGSLASGQAFVMGFARAGCPAMEPIRPRVIFRAATTRPGKPHCQTTCSMAKQPRLRGPGRCSGIRAPPDAQVPPFRSRRGEPSS